MRGNYVIWSWVVVVVWRWLVAEKKLEGGWGTWGGGLFL